jgi:hypothetical protein
MMMMMMMMMMMRVSRLHNMQASALMLVSRSSAMTGACSKRPPYRVPAVQLLDLLAAVVSVVTARVQDW